MYSGRERQLRSPRLLFPRVCVSCGVSCVLSECHCCCRCSSLDADSCETFSDHWQAVITSSALHDSLVVEEGSQVQDTGDALIDDASEDTIPDENAVKEIDISIPDEKFGICKEKILRALW